MDARTRRSGWEWWAIGALVLLLAWSAVVRIHNWGYARDRQRGAVIEQVKRDLGPIKNNPNERWGSPEPREGSAPAGAAKQP